MFGDNLNIDAKQKKLIEDYRKTHIECALFSDAEILTIMNEELGNIKINEEEHISAFWNMDNSFNPDEFKKNQNPDSSVIAEKQKSNNIFQVAENRLNQVSQSLAKSEKTNGFIGKAWSGFKNLTGIGDSSNKVRQQINKEKQLLNKFNSDKKNRAEIFKELTGQDYNKENLKKFINEEIKLKSELALNGYTEGQEMACDVAGDLVSGIAAVGLYSAVVASMPVGGGLLLAGACALGGGCAVLGGGAIKTTLKLADAVSGGREYTTNERDFATGAFSGLLAPITAGLGGAIGKTVATKLGIEVFKQGTKEGINIGAKLGLKPLSSVSSIFKQGIKEDLKSAILNPTGYSYGGTIGKKLLAYGAEMASDGAIGGAVDTAYRTAYDGGDASEVILAGIEGGIGGLFLAPIIGGGMKSAGKAGHFFGSKSKHQSESDLQVKELIKLNRGTISAADKIKMLNTIKNGKIEHKIKKLKFSQLFKTYTTTKKPFVVPGEVRFKPGGESKLLKKINNPYFEQNPALAESILKEMSEMTEKGFSMFKSSSNFYRFSDEELVDILSLVNEKNFDIFQLILRLKYDKEYIYKGSSFKDIFKLYSDFGSELSKKVIKMLKRNSYYANEQQELSKMLILSKQYPEEMKVLSYDFHPRQVCRIFGQSWEKTEELLKRMQTCTPEQKELVEILYSPKRPGGFIYSDVMIKILDTDTGLNNKQIVTFCKYSENYNGSNEMKKALDKFAEKKDKKFSFSTEQTYKKNEPMTNEEITKYLRTIGASEDDIARLCEHNIAETVIKLMEFDDMSESLVFGGISKFQIIKSINQIIKSDGKEEYLERVSAIEPVIRYINRENYEVFKLNHKNGDFEEFMNDLNSHITTMECSSICTIVNKLAGKTIYEKDLYALGIDMLKLINFTEQEVNVAIKKLKELDLITNDSNLLTLLTKTNDLLTIDITPELKEFAKYLSGNKFIEEGSLIDIIKSVQAKDNKVLNMRINYAKELVENINIDQMSVPKILKYLSSDNLELLKQQIEILKGIDIIEQDETETFAKFIKADDIKEFNTYKNLLNLLRKNNTHKDLGIILGIINMPEALNSKADVSDFVNSLLGKNFNIDKIPSLLYSIGECSGNKKEFMSLYLKGLDMDLGSLKESFEEIISLHVTDINSLNIKEKLKMYDKLSGLNKEEKNIIKQLGLDYDKLLDKVINSIGVKRSTVSIKSEQSQLFIRSIIANNNPRAEKFLREFDFAQFGKEGLPLKYTRTEFNRNVEALIKDLPKEEVDIILKHFGLEKGSAGFDGLLNNKNFSNKNISKEGQEIALKIQKEIEKFILNNEVMIADSEAKEVLDGLIKGMPEFTSIVGKIQHGRHDFSVDIHTLKVLQSAMNDPLYKTLSDQDKTILKYSILLHDLGKKGGVTDEGHAGLSAEYAWSILDRYPFPAGVKDRIIDIVDNHHWFEKYNTNKATAENVAVRCRRPEDLKIYEIFAKADLENVSKDFHFERTGTGTTEEFNIFMKNKYKAIEDAVNKIYQKANFIFDTQFMHNGQLFPTQKVTLNGKKETFKVLDFNKLVEGEELEKYGFAPGVTRDNARFIVHMTDPEFSNLETVYRLTETPVFQSTWSSSMVQMSNNNTYWGKDFGVIFDIPQSNYSEAFWGNTHSGGEKGLDAFQNYLFGSRKIKKEDVNGKKETWDVRHFVKDNFIKQMIEFGYNLSETEYAALSQYLFGKKYLSQIRKDVQIGEKVIDAKDLVKALEKSRDELFYGYEHSEIIPINPKIKGIFAKVDKIEDCPEDVLKFAKEHDLPIILMKKESVKDRNIQKKFKMSASDLKKYVDKTKN